MNLEKHLSETAFLVNESRSRMTDISRDTYSHLWLTNKTKLLWNDFAKKVYPHNDLALSIRNRYFLEHLITTTKKHKNTVFVNIACGFTSYPFLIKKDIKCIEIDLKPVINYKKNKIAKWQKENKLPKKTIDFVALNIEQNNDLLKLEKLLQNKLKGKHSFILLEGITYYLNIPTLKKIFNICANVQKYSDTIGFDYWTPKIKKHPVFIKLVKYFADKFNYKKQYNLFDTNFIFSIPKYKPLEITNITSKEIFYSNTSIMSDYNNILPVELAIIQRQ
jgi:O-methyltransferase involved in polyketide biosynthesis